MYLGHDSSSESQVTFVGWSLGSEKIDASDVVPVISETDLAAISWKNREIRDEITSVTAGEHYNGMICGKDHEIRDEISLVKARGDLLNGTISWKIDEIREEISSNLEPRA